MGHFSRFDPKVPHFSRKDPRVGCAPYRLTPGQVRGVPEGPRLPCGCMVSYRPNIRNPGTTRAVCPARGASGGARARTDGG